MTIGLRLSIKDKSLLLGNSFESGTQHPPDLSVPNIPIYWLIEINIPNAGPTAENGNRNHDYLYLEAGLYFDIIQADTGLVSDLQDLKDAGLKLKDLKTEQSTLEKIFVNLVREKNEN